MQANYPKTVIINNKNMPVVTRNRVPVQGRFVLAPEGCS